MDQDASVSARGEGALKRHDKDLMERLIYYGGRPERIERRLVTLDRAWTLERAHDAAVAGVGLAGVALSMGVSRKFLLLPLGALALLVQRAATGQSLVDPVLGKAGLRTRQQLEEERYGLKAIRGDFPHLPMEAPAEERMERVLAGLRARRETVSEEGS